MFRTTIKFPTPVCVLIVTMDRFTKLRVIGKGSFWQLILARSLADNQLCVIKEINVSHLSKKAQEEASNEVKILSALHHPNIVRYSDAFLESKKINIVMEFAEGGDLSDRIKKQGSVYFKEEVRFI